ncbi:FecR domain-containing protein [Halopseudomonas maritima]|uniref:FecR domain-containing protein n=1 Tax=Halopseudomonas maritima TaxID=2918528 RepID=UPI001EEA032F|nr:FecR domain-containing protein [Halopseudomonas maritima]UJJ31687.1 DUF4880 domain-containing protein [Halopseudomonas maritima]
MSSAEARHLPEATVRCAIAWQLQLASSDQRPRLRAKIDHWRAAHPDHELAWQRLRHLREELGDIAGRLPDHDLSLRLLERADTDLERRRALKLLGLALAVGAPAGWLAQQQVTGPDLHTATGEQQQQTLPGGVQVQLNTRSGLDITHVGQPLQLTLREGEVMIDSLGSEPPFQLQLRCAWGRCDAAQARFSVREHQGYSQVSVAQGALLLQAAGQRYQAQAGETLRLSQSGIAAASPALDPLAWSQGMLVADNLSLGRFIAELGRYRSGALGCDPSVANLRLSGVFQLAEPDTLLADLPRILPVQLVSRTRWWLRVVPA